MINDITIKPTRTKRIPKYFLFIICAKSRYIQAVVRQWFEAVCVFYSSFYKLSNGGKLKKSSIDYGLILRHNVDMERRDATHPKGIHLDPTVRTTFDNGSIFEIRGSTSIVEGMSWKQMMHQESLGRQSRKQARTLGLKRRSY